MATPPRFIALFGSRASGKTVYLASLYGATRNNLEEGTEYLVATRDEGTQAYLMQSLDALKAGEWPLATEVSDLRRLELNFTSDGKSHDLVLPDIAGELIELAKRDETYDEAKERLKEKIRDEFKDYHGFLVFAPVESDKEKRNKISKFEVEALIMALKERSPSDRKIARPLAILVTKWDRNGAIDPKTAEAEADAYFRENYPELAAALTATFKNMKVFPVSATGTLPESANNQPPKPPEKLAPFNLGTPLSWILGRFVEEKWESLESFVNSALGKLFERDETKEPDQPTFHSQAMRRIDDFLEDAPRGPFAEKARELRRELLGLRRKRRIKRAGVGIAVALLLVATAGVFRDGGARASASRLMEGKGSPRSSADVLREVDALLADRTRVMGRLTGWWGRLASTRDGFHQNYESSRYAEIAQLAPPESIEGAKRVMDLVEAFERDFPASSRRAEASVFHESAANFVKTAEEKGAYAGIKEAADKFNESPANTDLADRLINDCDQYLKDHPGGGNIGDVQRIKSEAETAKLRLQREMTFAQLEAALADAAGNPLKSHLICGEFLAKSPRHEKADEVRSRQEKYRKEADDQAWKAVEAFAAKYKTSYPEQLDRCRSYMSNALFQDHRDAAKKFEAGVLRGIDQDRYENIRRRARAGNEPEILESVRKLCQDYLNDPTNANKAMADDVKAWLAWFDSWVKGRDFHVDVESVRVDRGSRWHGWISSPKVDVGVGINGANHRSGQKSISLDRDERGLPDARLGSFHWKWGDPNIVAYIACKSGNPPFFDLKLPDHDVFSVRHLNGPLYFDGGKVSMRLVCPDVVPPTLKPYTE